MGRAYSLLSETGGVHPYWVYRRLQIGAAREYVLYTVPYGYNYWLRRVSVRWPERNLLLAACNPFLSVEFFSSSSQRGRQRLPVPIALLSSPGSGDSNVFPEAGAPYGQTMTAISRTSHKLLNVPLPYGETLRLEITGQVAVGVLWSPDYVDVLIEGYLVEERGEVAMWGGGKGS